MELRPCLAKRPNMVRVNSQQGKVSSEHLRRERALRITMEDTADHFLMEETVPTPPSRPYPLSPSLLLPPDASHLSIVKVGRLGTQTGRCNCVWVPSGMEGDGTFPGSLNYTRSSAFRKLFSHTNSASWNHLVNHC